MPTLSELQLKFSANVAEITRDLGSIEKNVQKFSKNVEGFGKAAAASLAAIGGAAVFSKMVDGAKEAEAAMAQVEAAIRSTHGAAGITAKEVGNLSNEIKRMTGIDDDLVNSMSSVLLTFTKVGKDVFPEATKAIVDMSARMGGDMKAAAIQVGKALNDPIQGISALQRVGVSFSEGQKKVIKDLVETGQVAKAQGIILKELETEFGGSAAAARDTLGGALQELQQNFDDLLDSIGGTQGFREVVEFANIVLRDMAAAMSEIRNPTSDASKQMAVFVKGISDAAYTARVWANTMIFGVQMVWKNLSAFGAGAVKVLKPLLDFYLMMNPAAKMMGEGVASAFKALGDHIANNDKIIRAAMKSGAMPDYFKYFDDAAKRATERMDELHKAASKVKPARIGGETEGLSKAQEKAQKEAEKAAKKQQALHDQEKKSIQGIIETYAQKNIDLEAQLGKHKEIGDQMEAERKISGMTNVSFKDRIAAINEIAKLTRERAELEKKIAIGAEREKLGDVLKNIKDQTEQLKMRNKHQEEMVPIIEAEKQIRDIIKIGLGENLDLQKQILDAAKAQSEVIKEQKHEESLKALKEMSGEYDKQLSALQAKLDGQEDLLPLLEQEKKIREDMYLTDQEKEAAIAANRDKFGQVQQMNQALENQKQVLEDVKNSAGSYQEKLGQLTGALNAGKINTKQWTEVANDLWQTQKKAKTSADEFASTLVNGLNKAITSGKNLKETLKDMGKQLALFAAQKLLLDPLQKAIANIGNRMMGTGQYTPSPFGGGGGGQLAGGYGMPSGPQLAMGGGGGGFGGSYPGLGSMMGGAVGAPGFQPATPSNVDENMLYDSWQYYSRTGRDALGFPIEDFEYYTKYLSRPEAIRRLGIAGVQGGSMGGGGGLWGGLPNPWSSAGRSFLSSQLPPQLQSFVGQHPLLGGAAMGLGGTLGAGLGMLKGLIPGFADGGWAASGKMAMFGERGPELAVPKDNMYVFNAEQTRGMMSGISISGGSSGGVPNIGSWVPQQRANLINQYGVDPEVMEMQDLNARMLANPETRAALMPKYLEAMDRWGMKGNQYEAEAKALAEQNVRNNAKKMYEDNPGPGSGGFGLAQQIAGSVLSSQAEVILGIRNGKVMMPAGNALETFLKMGLPISPGLMKYASSSDFLNQWSYNPDNVFDAKGFGFSYHSDGIGGNDFGPVGWGGDGRQYAQELEQQAKLQNTIQQNQERWNNVMKNNKNPLGAYQGASQDYLHNIAGWNKFAKPTPDRNWHWWGAGSTNWGGGEGSYSPGNSITNGPGGTMQTDPLGLPWWSSQGLTELKRNKPRFDPTVPSDEYQPKYSGDAGSGYPSFEQFAKQNGANTISGNNLPAGYAPMKGYAVGGIMKAGEVGVVGERGREFAIAAQDTAIIPSSGLPRGFGKTEVKVNVHNLPGYSSRVDHNPDGSVSITQVARAVAAEMNRLRIGA